MSRKPFRYFRTYSEIIWFDVMDVCLIFGVMM